MRLLLVGLVCIWQQLVSADIYSCGGFVKSTLPIDYSKVKVKLLTPEGHMKHEEDCNPQNGYYMIPIYNKGQYSLKVSAPEGWYFEPETIDFKLDGVNDACTKNEDINFVLSAFSVKGVVDDGSGSGPAGLPLTLSKNGKIIETTTTTKGGHYLFKTAPGVYEVSTGSSTSACIATGSAKVEVKDRPVVVSPPLRISGYHLSVSVSNKGSPLADVPITLYAASEKNLKGCIATKETMGESKFACSVGKTSASGTLDISCAPIGEYYVRPDWRQGDTVFQFAPKLAPIHIRNEKVQVSFAVSGFSARGRVTSQSKGVAKATVLVNGKQVGTTDKDGYYSLEGLKEGSLEVTATAANTKFSVVKTSLKLPSILIPDVVVEGFEVCGSVEKSRGSVEALVLKRKDNGDTVSIRPSSDGQFCRMVAPAKYSISPADSTSSLTPRALDVDLSNGAVEGLRFTHFKTDAEARVTCIGNCGAISLTLLLGETVVQTAEGADVVFRDIGPGKYTVRLSDGDRGCWENSDMSLLVERSKPQPVHFVQSGFSTKIELSHPASLTWSHAEKRQLKGELKAVAGQNAICVPVMGTYSVQLESCMNFQPQPISINVPSDSVTVVSAMDAKISGKITSKDKSTFKLKIKSSSGDREINVEPTGVFSFQQPLATAGDVILVPFSETHLFEPASYTLKFRGECVDNAVEFVADKGIFVDGSIQPPVEGAKVVAIHNKDANVRFETVSDRSGRFRVGPVRRAEDLSISATQDGYEITAQEGKIGKMNSVKLSHLSVVVSDVSTSERLDGVLLSVVGGKSYRSNNMIDASGEVNFVGLAPGDYFLRPILQEYKFDPTTTTITVKEGEHEKVALKGKRVSFSAWGRVREMSAAPVAGVIVEALSEQCDQHQSEATTEQDGTFRIRALRPACTYRVAIKGAIEGVSVPHCFPSQFEVRMTSEDVKGLDMVAAPSDHTTELAVELDFSSLSLPDSYRVSVIRNGDVITQSTIHAPVTVFYLPGLERNGQEYSVRVEPDKPVQAFHAKTVFFTADAPVRVVRIPMTSSKRAGEVEIEMSSILALPFFALLALVFFNQNKAIEMARGVYAYILSHSSSNDRRKRKNN